MHEEIWIGGTQKRLNCFGAAKIQKVLLVAALVAGGGGEIDTTTTPQMAHLHPRSGMKNDLEYEAQKYEESHERTKPVEGQHRANKANV